MSSSLRRGTLAATTLALAVATLSACGAGNSAQTLEIKPDNSATTVGKIKFQNVIIFTAKGSGTEATVTGRIFNNGTKDQTLESVTINGSNARAKLSPAKGEKALKIPAGGSLALGGKNEAAAQLSNWKTAGIQNGNAQPVSFDLSSTGSVKMRAAVYPVDSSSEKFGPTAQPSPQSDDSPSGSAKPGQEDKPGGAEQGRNGSEDSKQPSDGASTRTGTNARQGANDEADTSGDSSQTQDQQPGTGTSH